MGQFVASSLTICSIYPIKLGPERRPYGTDRESGSTIFEIPAVDRDADPPYALLRVTDSWQRTRDWMQHPGTPGEYKHDLIFAEQIASDLIQNWTTGLLAATEGGHPGVGIIAGAKPTAVELATMGEKQTRYFEALYYAGQKMALQNDWRNITERHRQAAIWLGKSPQDAAWIKPFNPLDQISCPLCQSRISALAVICGSCGRQIREMPPELAKLNAQFAGAGAPTPAGTARRQ